MGELDTASAKVLLVFTLMASVLELSALSPSFRLGKNGGWEYWTGGTWVLVTDALGSMSFLNSAIACESPSWVDMM
jgi:hypothetical protein